MDTPRTPRPRFICLFFGLALVLTCLLAIFGREQGGPAAAFDYFRNNWSVVGLPDYDRGTRITPDGQLLLGGTRRAAIECGTPLAGLGPRAAKTLLEGWLPIVRMEALSGSIRYEFLTWAAPLPWAPDVAAAFAGPAGDGNFASWILVRAVNTGKTAARAAVRFRYWDAGREYADVAESPEKKTAAGAGRTIAQREWTPLLPPGGAAEEFAAVPFFPLPPERGDHPFGRENPRAWLERTTAFWKAKMAGAARIEVPERKAVEALRAAHVCQLLALDKGELHAGEGFYDVFYIRDGAYQVMALEEADFAAESKKAMEPFLKNQLPDGRFETQKGQLDANGQAVWALWQYAAFTGDRAWLERAYPQMLRAARWTIQARRKTAADTRFPGLLPPAPADGEYLWEGQNHIVGYDLWNLRGLVCAADAARRLGRAGEAAELEAAARLYRADIDAAWKRTGLAYLPPSWENQGTPWGNTEILWPVPVLDRNDPRVAAGSRFVRTEYAGGYKEGVIRWVAPKVRPAIHPYMGAYTSLNDLEAGRHESVVQDFYAYLLHSSATQAFPEGVHYEQREAWGDTIPHATGAGNYALLLRHMLVHEAGAPGGPDELHLLAAVPDWWLEEGREILIERAPTRFGEVGLRIRGEAGGVRAEISLPKTAKGLSVVLHLPRRRPLLGTAPGVRVEYRTAQTKRWDFETVVREYERNAPPPF